VKILVEYDKDTGEVTMPDGYKLIAVMGMDYQSANDSKSVDVGDLVKLKDGGYSTDEII